MGMMVVISRLVSKQEQSGEERGGTREEEGKYFEASSIFFPYFHWILVAKKFRPMRKEPKEYIRLGRSESINFLKCQGM